DSAWCSIAPTFRDWRAPFAAADPGEPGAAPPRRRLLLDCGWRPVGAVRRRRGDLVPPIQRTGAALWPLDGQFRATVPALLPAAYQHAVACNACRLRRDLDRRPERLCGGAPPLASLGADRYRGNLPVRGCGDRPRHRPRARLFE